MTEYALNCAAVALAMLAVLVITQAAVEAVWHGHTVPMIADTSHPVLRP